MSNQTQSDQPGVGREFPIDFWKTLSFEKFGAIDVLDYAPTITGDASAIQTLLVLPSIVFPGAPSTKFIDALNGAGYRVVCTRRRGFGLTTAGHDCEHELELLRRLIDKLGLQNVRCLALGSSAPLALNLYKGIGEVHSVDFVNISSAAVPENAIQNQYLKKMVAQSIVGRAGAHMVVSAIKWQIRRKGPLSFAGSLYAPSVDDVEYLRINPEIMWDAVAAFSSASPTCIRDEIVAAFLQDHEPVHIPEKRGFSVLTGPDVAEVFKVNAVEFSKKCGAETMEFSRGGVLSIYMCADEYVDFIRAREKE